jgi:hypothetical protein
MLVVALKYLDSWGGKSRKDVIELRRYLKNLRLISCAECIPGEGGWLLCRNESRLTEFGKTRNSSLWKSISLLTTRTKTQNRGHRSIFDGPLGACIFGSRVRGGAVPNGRASSIGLVVVGEKW